MNDCGTGCRKKEHMVTCPKCGEEYHIGLIHFCATNKINYNHYETSYINQYPYKPKHL